MKRLSDMVAVDGVSFDVQRGETSGLLGPNGAGKTAVMGILMAPVTTRALMTGAAVAVFAAMLGLVDSPCGTGAACCAANRAVAILGYVWRGGIA